MKTLLTLTLVALSLAACKRGEQDAMWEKWQAEVEMSEPCIAAVERYVEEKSDDNYRAFKFRGVRTYTLQPNHYLISVRFSRVTLLDPAGESTVYRMHCEQKDGAVVTLTEP